MVEPLWTEIIVVTGDFWGNSFLMQRISMATQIGNSAYVVDSMPDSEWLENIFIFDFICIHVLLALLNESLPFVMIIKIAMYQKHR